MERRLGQKSEGLRAIKWLHWTSVNLPCEDNAQQSPRLILRKSFRTNINAGNCRAPGRAMAWVWRINRIYVVISSSFLHFLALDLEQHAQSHIGGLLLTATTTRTWPTMHIDREIVVEAVRILQSLTPTSRSSQEESPCSSGVQSSSTRPTKLLSDKDKGI